MKKHIVKYSCPRITRESLSNPFEISTINERKELAGAVSLKNNIAYKDLGNGYFEIKPKNPKKLK